MPSKLTASVARQNFSDILSRAEYRGERVIVHRGKKAVAAVVPIEDVERGCDGPGSLIPIS